MRFLLDTQVWLWMRAAPERLSATARALLMREDSEILLSAASPWEIAIKVAIGKLSLPCSVEDFVTERAAQTRATHLHITHVHAIESASLPFHHRDPFDRILVAQARLEAIPIMTSDPVFKKYDVSLMRA